MLFKSFFQQQSCRCSASERKWNFVVIFLHVTRMSSSTSNQFRLFALMDTIAENTDSQRCVVISAMTSVFEKVFITDTVYVGKKKNMNACLNFKVTWVDVTFESSSEYPNVCLILPAEKLTGFCHPFFHLEEGLSLRLENLQDCLPPTSSSIVAAWAERHALSQQLPQSDSSSLNCKVHLIGKNHLPSGPSRERASHCQMFFSQKCENAPRSSIECFKICCFGKSTIFSVVKNFIFCFYCFTKPLENTMVLSCGSDGVDDIHATRQDSLQICGQSLWEVRACPWCRRQ